MDIQALINEVVAKLMELDAALGDQHGKVKAAISALTGEPIPDDTDPELRAAAQAAISRLAEVKAASDGTAQ
jgi:hypothetical protein